MELGIMLKSLAVPLQLLAGIILVVPPPVSGADVPIPERVYRDVDRQPLPFGSDTEIESFLRTASITAQQDIGTGVTKPKKLVLEKDGLKVHAAFNYVDLAGTKEKMADGTVEMFFLDSYRADIATYRLDRLLGLRMIPPGVERQIDGVDGVVRLWIEDLESYEEWLEKDDNTGTPDSLYLKRQLKDQITFDLLIRNTDRNQSNINWDPDWNLWMIDQTRSLAKDPGLRDQEKKKFKGCSRALYQAIGALDKAELKRELGDYIGVHEINALVKRKERLIKLIQSEIKEQGEDEVLFNYTDPPKGLVIHYDDD